MKYSLVSREVIADSDRNRGGLRGMDGFVAIGGCDKNMPGCLMAMARLNRPAVFVYGGTILPGCIPGRNRATSSQSSKPWARMPTGKIDDKEFQDDRVVRHSRPRIMRGHVHRQHDGFGHRGAGHEPAKQLRPERHLQSEKSRIVAAPARPW